MTHLRDEQSKQTLRDRDLVKREGELKLLLSNIEDADQKQSDLALRFELVKNRKQLEDQLSAIQHELEAQITLIGQANSRSIEAIRRERQKLQRECSRVAATEK